MEVIFFHAWDFPNLNSFYSSLQGCPPERVRPRRLCLLHQLWQSQGERALCQPKRRPRLLLGAYEETGQGGGKSGEDFGGGIHQVFRLPPPGKQDRCGHQRPEPGHPGPQGSDGQGGGDVGQVRRLGGGQGDNDEVGAETASLGRIQGATQSRRILAGGHFHPCCYC